MSTSKDFTSLTLEHYQQNSNSFWAGTKGHDVDQNYHAFQTQLKQFKDVKILEFGCGPGRDLKYFTQQGYEAIGLDGCSNFCEMARSYSHCEVWAQDFCHLQLPKNYFHGVFANASLFHIPKTLLLDVLTQLNDCLVDEGILFSSNPRGSDEYFDGTRYGNYMELAEYEAFHQRSGFEVVDHYYRPQHKPRPEQPWLAIVAKKL